MTTLPPTLGWDADGVLIDSRAVAFKVAEDVVHLFGSEAQISSPEEYKAAFGSAAQSDLVGAENTGTLRAMHRLLMRARAGEVAVFEHCLTVVRRMRERPLLITAAYGAGIKRALGADSELFVDIRGRESGRKETLMELAAAAGLMWYVTDTVRDIKRCRACGLAVIAVTWGYDTAEALADAGADFVVSDAAELTKVLDGFSLMSTDGGDHGDS